MPSPSLDAWHSSLGGRVHLSPCVSLHLSPVVSPPGCLARLSGWTRSFVSLGSLVSLCLPSFVSRCLPAWMIQSGWTGSCVSLCHLSPVVSQPGCLARLSGWTGSFVSLCLPSFVSQPGWLARLGFICLPLSPFICLPLSPSLDAWVDRFTCLPLSPFICRPLSPSLDLERLSGWTGSCVSLCLPSFVSRSLPAWMPGTALWVDGFICLPLSPLISPVVSQPGCLARLSGWTGSFVSLCLPSFVSRCLPAWMPGAALWVDGFICLPLSPRMSGTPLFPFICLPLSPSLDAWHFLVDRFTFLPLSPLIWPLLSPSLDVCHGSHLSPLVPFHLSPISVGGRIHLFPFVSLYLSPVVSQPGCLAWLSGWTDSFVSRCLPAWMCGTHAPRFPSLPAVLSFWRGLVCLRLWPWLRSFLVLWMLGTGSSSVCPSSGLRFRLGSWWVVFLVYRWLHPVCSFSASLSVAVPS